jgi:hypothetical protein
VLHGRAVEHAREVVQQRVDEQRARLSPSISAHSYGIKGGARTYSTRKTVRQLICGPRSLTASSAPSSCIPVSFKSTSSARAARSPTREIFWRAA